MNPVKVTARVTAGKLPHAHGRQIDTLLRASEGKLVTVTVEEAKRRRTIKANAYLWGVVYPAITAMFREAGNDADVDVTHEYCKLHVGKLRRTINTPDGEVKEILGSTRELTPRQFNEYLERVLAFAAEHGCYVPSPGEFNHQQEQDHEPSLQPPRQGRRPVEDRRQPAAEGRQAGV